MASVPEAYWDRCHGVCSKLRAKLIAIPAETNTVPLSAANAQSHTDNAALQTREKSRSKISKKIMRPQKNHELELCNSAMEGERTCRGRRSPPYPPVAPTRPVARLRAVSEQGKHVLEIFGYSQHRWMYHETFIRSGAFSVGGHDWSVLFYGSTSTGPALPAVTVTTSRFTSNFCSREPQPRRGHPANGDLTGIAPQSGIP
ncbi:hypothetical protein EJB05_57064, partial [Eragrostis curvula]